MAKKAVNYVKKLPSVEKKLQSAKTTIRKVNNGAKKTISKAKLAISNVIKKEAAKDIASESIRGATTSALQSGATGGDMKQAAIDGAISGAAYGALGIFTNGSKVLEVGINIGAGSYSGYKDARSEGKSVAQAMFLGTLRGIQQGGLARINWQKNLTGNDWVTSGAKWVTNRVADVYGVSTGIVLDIVGSQ